MTESEFLVLADNTLNQIEAALDRLADMSELDVECCRSGNLLEVEFGRNASKIIINAQAAMQELWVAAKSGGFHFRHTGGHWINTRDGTELIAALSQMVSTQSGSDVVLKVC
jgi:CyaY protein